jgi:hypothetical protein
MHLNFYFAREVSAELQQIRHQLTSFWAFATRLPCRGQQRSTSRSSSSRCSDIDTHQPFPL